MISPNVRWGTCGENPIFISIIIENLVGWDYYPSRKTKSNQELLLVRGIERLNTRTLQVENKRTLEII